MIITIREACNYIYPYTFIGILGISKFVLFYTISKRVLWYFSSNTILFLRNFFRVENIWNTFTCKFHINVHILYTVNMHTPCQKCNTDKHNYVTITFSFCLKKETSTTVEQKIHKCQTMCGGNVCIFVGWNF